MGLLDEAIREHMELKRLRGADPGEVARMERDALGPVVREQEDPREAVAFEDEEHSDFGHAGSDSDRHGQGDPAYGDGAHDGDVESSVGPHPAARGRDFANVGQETAELDMRTVLDGEPEDGFEEAPPIQGEMPGQERLRFDQQQTPRDFDFDP